MWLILAVFLMPFSVHGYDRIVSLSPQITESIYILEAEVKVVGVSDFCARPKEVVVKEKMGSPLRPDTEKIISVRPDMVLGSREGNSPLVMARFERLGVRVHYFDRPRTFRDLMDNFLTLARIVGKEEKGKEIVAAALKALPSARSEGTRILWEVGAEPLIAASSTSFANDIIRLAGGTNIIQSEFPYPRINPEEVMVKAPSIIVLMNMGYNAQAEMDRWRARIKDVRFVVFDAYAVGSPTPVSFAESVQRLADTVTSHEKGRAP
jgi:iron complex transport system substrate-binding protein